ncbi:MAG: hypothetical protein H8D45_06600 [Bacteroidetes bacterium]|nr:hypothetical protein [Bacteroidota bacterium]
MKISSRTFLFLFIIAFVDAQTFTGSAAFLKRGMSARAIGMGSAYTAVASDASATFWNPAGLLNNKGFHLQLSDLQDDVFNVDSFGDVNSPQFALSYSFRKPLLKRIYWAFGVAANGFFVKNIDHYDSESNYIDSFNYGEYAVFFSTAFKVRFLKLGITWKFIEQNFGLGDPFIQNNHESLIQKPHDIGVMFNPIKYLTVGMIVRNSFKVGVYDYYPRSSQLGIKFDLNAVKLSLPRLILAADVIVIQNSLNKVNVGLEYEHQFNDDLSVAIRAGSSNMIVGMKGKIDNLNEIAPMNLKGALGLGIKFKKIWIDLGWVQELRQNPYSKFFVWTISF